jgi:dihydroflavonol-4-reductase
MTDAKSVLVTGGSGYIAGWIIIALLHQGYRVKTTIRNLKRESEVRATLARHTALDDRLHFVQADLLNDSGWEEAATDCEYVLHVASPIPFGDHAKADLVKSAREGTRRVLDAASATSTKRVVITSSVAACTANLATSEQAPTDEKVWTDLNAATTNEYARSKTLAEKDAWSFAEKVRGHMEIVSVLPSAVLGPILGADNSGSLELVSRLLAGKIPAIPNLGFSIVDVRDLVDLHLSAMTSPAAAGQRFIGSKDYLWMSEIADILRTELGAEARKVPTMRMPNFLMNLLAVFQPEYKEVTHNLGRRRDYTSAKACDLLGWRPRSSRETIIDCARSMLM